VSPLLIGGFVDRGVSWQNYYFIPLFLSLVLAVVAFFVFRGCTMIFAPSISPVADLNVLQMFLLPTRLMMIMPSRQPAMLFTLERSCQPPSA
jgi:hypothetical protein